MKRLLFWAGTMVMTTAVGIGVHRLIRPVQVDKAPPQVEAISLAAVELQRELVAPVAPIPPVPHATPHPILVLDYDQEKFTPWAVFYVMGRKPKAFADVDSLEVGLSGHVEAGEGYIAVNTLGSDSEWNSASAIFALVTERRLFFVTSQMRNSEVEYRFDGTFLRTDFATVEGKNIAVLRGTLTKTKNGRKIAEQTFDFRMEHLGC